MNKHAVFNGSATELRAPVKVVVISNNRNLLILRCRVTLLAIEVIQVLGFDEIKARFIDALEQGNDLAMTDCLTRLCGHETTAPVVDTKGFTHFLRPYFSTTISDHGQFKTVAADTAEVFAQFFGSAIMPIEEDIHTHKILYLGFVVVWSHMFVGDVLRRRTIIDGFELFWLLAETGNNSSGELVRTHLLFAHLWFEDIICMNAILKSAQPGIVHQRGNIWLADMHQHHHSAQQEP